LEPAENKIRVLCDPLPLVGALERPTAAHRILGTACAAVGEHIKAELYLRRAVGLAPDDERSRLALARVLRDAGRLDEAAQFLRETLEAFQRLRARALEDQRRAYEEQVKNRLRKC